MNLNGSLTDAGRSLSAKLLTGGTLRITRVLSGNGDTPLSAAALSGPQQTLSLSAVRRKGTSAVLPVTLTAAEAQADYALTELGVYVRDPDAGEVLFCRYRMDAPVPIAKASPLVLRFFLQLCAAPEEVPIQVIPAGLVTQGEFEPVRSQVMATRTASRAVTVAAAELQAYLNALPRLLTEHITLKAAGALDSQLALAGFYGSGSLTIDGENALVISSGDAAVYLSGCAAPITLQNLTVASTQTSGSVAASCYVSGCQRVTFSSCTFTEQGYDHAIRCRSVGRCAAYSCTFTGNYSALSSEEGSFAHVVDAAASGNTVGGRVIRGALLLLAGTTPELLGGSVNVKQGGAIARADGTWS